MATVKTAIYFGETVKVLAVIGGWTTIELPNGESKKVRNGALIDVKEVEANTNENQEPAAGAQSIDEEGDKVAQALEKTEKTAKPAKAEKPLTPKQLFAKYKAYAKEHNEYKCPVCGSTETYAGRTKPDASGLGVVVDEDKVFGCHHCDWEYEIPGSGIKAKKSEATADARNLVDEAMKKHNMDVFHLAVKVKLAKTPKELHDKYAHLNPGHQIMTVKFRLVALAKKQPDLFK